MITAIYLKQQQELQQCLHCLQDTSDLLMKEECTTTKCLQSVSTKDVCHVCKEKGFELWCPVLKRCDHSLEKGLQCTRAVCLNITTDCQLMFKAALELLQITKAMEPQIHAALW